MVSRPARRHHIKRRVAKSPKKTSRAVSWVVALLGLIGVLTLAGALGLFVVVPKILLAGTHGAHRTIITASDPTLPKNHVLLIASSGDDKKSFYWLDGSEKIVVPGGYGEYELRAAVALLALEKKDERQFHTGLSHALSAVITDVVTADESWTHALPADIETLPLREQTKKLSRYFFVQALRSLPDIEQARQNFQLHAFFDEYVSLTEKVAVVKPSELAAALEGEALVSAKQSQDCPVAIINTTEVAGLATHVTDLVEQSGAVVIRSEHESLDQPATTLLTSEEYTASCDEVLRVFGAILPTEAARKQLSSDALLAQYRAKLVLLLGDDLGTYYQ